MDLRHKVRVIVVTLVFVVWLVETFHQVVREDFCSQRHLFRGHCVEGARLAKDQVYVVFLLSNSRLDVAEVFEDLVSGGTGVL